MNDFGRPFGPDELPSADDRSAAEVPSADLADALLMGREIESGLAPGAAPSRDFTDRVMAALADEPVPQPVVATGRALRSGRFLAALASLGDAWRVAFGAGRPTLVRAQALALVATVALGMGLVAGTAAVGAFNYFRSDTSLPVVPSPTPDRSARPSTPAPSPSPSVSPSTPGPSPSPTEAPSATEEVTPSPTGTKSPTRTPRPTGTDDHGGDRTPRPTESDDHGGDRTPRPTGTDDHSADTADPTDDHSGSSDDS